MTRPVSTPSKLRGGQENTHAKRGKKTHLATQPPLSPSKRSAQFDRDVPAARAPIESHAGPSTIHSTPKDTEKKYQKVLTAEMANALVQEYTVRRAGWFEFQAQEARENAGLAVAAAHRAHNSFTKVEKELETRKELDEFCKWLLTVDHRTWNAVSLAELFQSGKWKS